MKINRSTLAQMLLLILGLAILLHSAEAIAAFQPPQASALAMLRAESLSPVQVTYHGGFPSSVLMEVPAAGATPTERARAFLERYADFYLQDHPDVALVHSQSGFSDEEGEIVRFAQTYRGLPVFAAEIVVHVSSDTAGPQRVFGTAGRLFIPARTSSATPIEPAIDMGAMIGSAQAEGAARQALGIATAPVRGETRLMLFDPSIVDQPGPPRLVWRVHLENAHVVQFLIDAIDSAVLYREDIVETSSGLTDLDLVVIDAELTNMNDTTCFLTAGTVIGDEGGMYPGAQIADPEAVVAWNAARSTYLMYHDTLGRHSYDDDDGEILVAVHAHLGFPTQPNATAASWCGMQFSNGWVADDVLAHEFGHLVIDETSDLLGTYPSGALNESYADTMAMLVDTSDWLLGEAMTDPNVFLPIRDFQDPTTRNCFKVGFPPSGPCPDRYSARHILPVLSTFDNGGVHINAGITNKAHFLMAAGGTFNGRTVVGMGRTKMGRIVHRAAINLPSNADLFTMRNQMVGMAQYMQIMNQGITAQNVCSVKNAYAAVELGAGDANCDGVNDTTTDSDGDGILDDGDFSGNVADSPCIGGNTLNCDDNCLNAMNPDQANFDNDWIGDICDTDDDNDGVPDGIDNCPGGPGDPSDADNDGVPNCVDGDDDNDGVPDDGDGSGVAGDNPCQDGATASCDDNCRLDPNPTQYDGNSNGFGDACDPDLDGDGLYVLEDNCTFVANPGQQDADGDGIGDACDKCPNVADSVNAYTYPVNGQDPEPYQPDSDGDGVPDACDNLGFGSTGMMNDGDPYGALNVVNPDGGLHTLEFHGPAGGGQLVRLAFPACDTGDPHGVEANERIQFVLAGFPPSLRGWIEDGRGRVVGRFRPDASGMTRGLRFRPRCHEQHFLFFASEAGFDGYEAFTATATALWPSGDNPWTSNAALYSDPPPLPPDQDGDGAWDGIDTCPAVYDPTNADADGDGAGDACDATPGGPVALVLSGVVVSIDDGAGAPQFPGIAPGVPFTGRLTYDTTMPVDSVNYPVSRSYAEVPPFEPLELSAVVAGFEFSAGPGSLFEVTVEDYSRLGVDRFTVTSLDIGEHAAPAEILMLTLADPTSMALSGLALPPSLDLADFAERTIAVDIDGGTPDSSMHLLLEITAMSLPYQEPRLYWVDSDADAIRGASLDGFGIVTLINADDPVGFEVDTAGGRIYWTECCPGKVRRSALDGSGVADLVTGLVSPFGIGLDPPGGSLLFADAAAPGPLYSASVGGGAALPLLTTTPNLPYAVAVDWSAAKVYWTEHDSSARIRRANLDGSGPENLVTGSSGALSKSHGLALDPPSGKMYWTDLELARIYRANLDGTGPELLADVASAGLQDPTGIALDSIGGKMYWTDTSRRLIQRANLDGTMVETVLDEADGLLFPRDLYVDPGNGCEPPASALFINPVTLSGGADPLLTIADPNPAPSVTGYNIYRSSDASPPKAAWPLVALGVPDADPVAAGVQWTDLSGDASPTGIWYYTAVAYNASCPLEGPQ